MSGDSKQEQGICEPSRSLLTNEAQSPTPDWLKHASHEVSRIILCDIVHFFRFESPQEKQQEMADGGQYQLSANTLVIE